jgi:transposase-like protein
LPGIRSYNAPYGTRMIIRQVKYLNNVLEPDRRAVKRGMRPLLEIKSLATAQGTLVGLNMSLREENSDARTSWHECT